MIKADKKKAIQVALVAGFVSATALITHEYNKYKERLAQAIPKSNKSIPFRELSNTLEDEIKRSSSVFIVGHNSPDLDAIGSSIGLYHLAHSYGKKAYIIVDDEESKIEPGTKKVIDEVKSKFKIITKRGFQKLVNKDSLLIMTDVNKQDMISVGDSLSEFRKIIIIDHHSTNENTVPTRHRYINEEESSASEIVSKVLFAKKVKLIPEVANALLAGISLDTKRFKHNAGSETHDVAEKLIEKGADMEFVNTLFLQDFDTHCRIENLIINGTIIRRLTESLLSPIHASFTLNRNNPLEEHVKEDYAKAADEMLKFAGVDAAFVMGYIEPGTIHVSARGNKRVNVGKIMDALEGGGGTPQSAGAKIESSDILDIERQILAQTMLVVGETEKVLDEPQVVKKIQLKYPAR